MLAIITAFEQWRHYLDGAQHTITIFCDHRNLQYFASSRVLNRRQARWSLFLADFDFVISYRPGAQQGKPDALSRRHDFQPAKGDMVFQQQQATILKPHQLKIHTLVETPTDQSLLTHIKDQLKTDALALDILLHLGEDPPDTPGLRHDYDRFSASDGLIFRDGLLYVPDVAAHLDILLSRHDSNLAGHFGISKTLELVTRDYWWPQLRKFVQQYVKSCDICSRAKPVHHKPYGCLLPLPVPTRSWQSISMDFIVDLPLSNGFDSVLVVVDRLSKMAHFIPCTKDVTSEQTALLVFQNVIRLHGLPDNIISDRGTQFASRFWSRLFGLLGTDINLSSAFHPQTDGQSERVNQVLEQYLHCTINYQQDNWTDLLPTAEFAYNNATHASTKMTPFYANYGYCPCFEFKPSTHTEVPAADDHVAKMQDITQMLTTELELAQGIYQFYADQHRVDAPLFEPGDKVWLLRRNIATRHPSSKLDYKRLGPFTIADQINPVAFRLNLLLSMKVHDVFHVSLLEPYVPNTLPGQLEEPPPPDIVDGEPEYEVEEILDSRIFRRKLQYLVSWKGYDISEWSWEPVENFSNHEESVLEFHRRYLLKPGPRGILRGG